MLCGLTCSYQLTAPKQTHESGTLVEEEKMSPIVSVIICTHNRVQYLVQAIESVLEQVRDPQSCEVIVVDNASTDATPDTVRSLASNSTNLKYVTEHEAGLSRARNTGLESARGEYVAYIDDDATVESGWLARIPATFDEGGKEVACVAGRIIPIWDAPRPSWLHDDILSYLSVLDASSVPIRLSDDQTPFGANVIYRRGVLAKVGGFSNQLGRVGKRLLSNEEVLLQKRLMQFGYYTYYDPNVSVRHHIHAERITKAWIRRRAYWQGVSDAILEKELTPGSSVMNEIRRMRALLPFVRHPLRLVALLNHWSDDPRVFATGCFALRTIGYGTAGLRQLL